MNQFKVSIAGDWMGTRFKFILYILRQLLSSTSQKMDVSGAAAGRMAANSGIYHVCVRVNRR